MSDEGRVRCLTDEPKASPVNSDESFIAHNELTKNHVILICFLFYRQPNQVPKSSSKIKFQNDVISSKIKFANQVLKSSSQIKFQNDVITSQIKFQNPVSKSRIL